MTDIMNDIKGVYGPAAIELWYGGEVAEGKGQ